MIGLGLPVWASAATEFWNQKKPEDWTEDERRELLAKSPWAREAVIKVNDSVGGLGVPRGRTMSGGYGGGSRRSGPVSANPGTTNPTAEGKYHAIVRWESALPVREATHNQSKDDPAANYILNIVGDVPMLGRRSNDETETEFQQRLDMLKQYTKLEKKGDPIYLVKVAYQAGPPATSGTLFYFERNDLITVHDGTVTFVTKLGPLDVRCKFAPKEMLYLGKLEL
jgi:hypothetical protein